MLTFTVAMALSGFAAAEKVSQADAAQLMQDCKSQRQEQIAPLKKQEIEQCISKGRGDREYCERYNRNFGEKTAGGARLGLFWDLPVCQKALAADRYFNMNPGSNTYNSPG